MKTGIPVSSDERVFLGLIHGGSYKGMVAPALSDVVTEEELRGLVHDAFCMRCAEEVSEDDLEAEYA